MVVNRRTMRKSYINIEGVGVGVEARVEVKVEIAINL